MIGGKNFPARCVYTEINNDRGLQEARQGRGSIPKEQTALEFADRIVSKHGMVTDQDVQRVREAGYSDGDIMEIIANITLNILANYVNLVAGTSIDFPVAQALSAA
ncbi:MAG: hypothetical protein WD601_08000 [Pseudohongiellaceae bacterium]